MNPRLWLYLSDIYLQLARLAQLSADLTLDEQDNAAARCDSVHRSIAADAQAISKILRGEANREQGDEVKQEQKDEAPSNRNLLTRDLSLSSHYVVLGKQGYSASEVAGLLDQMKKHADDFHADAVRRRNKAQRDVDIAKRARDLIKEFAAPIKRQFKGGENA